VADPSKDLINVANHLRIACSALDCTTLNYGGSCNEIRAKKKKNKKKLLICIQQLLSVLDAKCTKLMIMS
jgi:hypothetical protein